VRRAEIQNAANLRMEHATSFCRGADEKIFSQRARDARKKFFDATIGRNLNVIRQFVRKNFKASTRFPNNCR
jgi:hypothetical protein